VNAGVDHDTSVFAVESIRRWWKVRGGRDYPQASRLLITADAGGSSSYRYQVGKNAMRGAWNYTLHPQRAAGSAGTAPAGESRVPAPRSCTSGRPAP